MPLLLDHPENPQERRVLRRLGYIILDTDVYETGAADHHRL